MAIINYLFSLNYENLRLLKLWDSVWCTPDKLSIRHHNVSKKKYE